MTASSAPATSVATSPPRQAWVTPINGFRGIGALVVVVGHTFFATRIFPWRGVIHLISIVVPIFFVISGFALYRPFVAAQLEGADPPAARTFWWRRFLRIYPLYGVALTLYLIVLPGVRPESGRVLDYLKLYGFAQIYDPELVTFSGIPAAWFLCDEVVFYLLLPALAWVGSSFAARLRRRRSAADSILLGHALLAVIMIVVGQCSRVWLLSIDFPGATSLPIANADYYGFGILLALASLRLGQQRALPRPVELIRSRPWITIGILIVVAVGQNAIAVRPGETSGGSEDIARYGLYSLVTIPLMITMVLGEPDRSFNRILSWRGWDRLALLSLHTYLWHQLALGAFDLHVTEIAEVDLGSRAVTGLALVALVLVVTVVWSAAWRPLLDLPYRLWRDAIPRAGDRSRSTVLRPAALTALGIVAITAVPVAIRYGRSPIDIRAGTEIVTVTGARPGDEIRVLPADELTRSRASTVFSEREDRPGDGAVAEGQADEEGTLLLRDIAPGRYEVVQRRDGRDVLSRDLKVRSATDHPEPSWYRSQDLGPGDGHIVTRDGTRLAVHVDLPGPVEDGPYPTVVELSAYRIGDAGETQPATAIARALGYATVGINVRGSGCSAGAFELFGPSGVADGYDVVETVAAQPWVARGEVGLVGFSLGGLNALQAASAAPPSLTSVAALSVYGDAREAFHPGGLANSGFPVGWMTSMDHDVRPSGTAWVRKRIEDGDRDCEDAQQLHRHAVPLVHTFVGPDVPRDDRFDALSPSTWAPDITVPTFLSLQLQDATTGTDLPRILDRFDDTVPVRLVLTNGTHGDAVSPQLIDRLSHFLSVYVEEEKPAPVDAAAVLHHADPTADATVLPSIPPSPIVFPSEMSATEARTLYEASDPVELLIASGAGSTPGMAAAAASTTFRSWPPEGLVTTYRLGADGEMSSTEPQAGEPAAFRTDGSLSGDAYNVEGTDLLVNSITPWREPTPGTSTAWTSPPTDRSRLLVGDTSVTVWVRADGDTDLQAVLSTLDPTGHETFVQAGWRRMTAMGQDAAIRDGWSRMRFELGPAGHLLSAGSSLRLRIGTPGDGQVQFSFYPPPDGDTEVLIARSAELAGELRVTFVDPPAGLDVEPACGDLRAQPCRPVSEGGETP